MRVSVQTQRPVRRERRCSAVVGAGTVRAVWAAACRVVVVAAAGSRPLGWCSVWCGARVVGVCR